MRIAIVHYHLRTGGVTRVVQNAIKASQPHQIQCVLFTGEMGQENISPHPNTHVMPALKYNTTPDTYPISPLLKAMKEIAIETLGGTPDIWHIHNHSLGKNTVIPELIRQLALDGEKMLLQIHDFPEDGRPANYHYLQQALGSSTHLDQCLYPQGSHIHYATLNGRDYSFLQAAGINKQQLHLLPNAVSVQQDKPNEQPVSNNGQRLFLYPTRAIRRKNLGEFLLWSTGAEPNDLFATSLIPENPVARKIHDSWVTLAHELSLPIEFARGQDQHHSLADLYSECFSVVTTSVAEGFGLAFLEPWLFDRPLLGRNIPDITHEFSKAGIDLENLYPHLMVPIDFIDLATFKHTITSTLAPFMEAYGRALSSTGIQQAIDAAMIDDKVDFGRLDEPLQAQVIRKVVQQPKLREHIIPDSLCPAHINEQVISTNRVAVETQFGLAQYGERLSRMYSTICDAASEPATSLPHQQVLDQFLKPERFTLLRT